jgi:hypothetical protein
MKMFWTQNVGEVKASIFWDITPCSPLKVNRRFGRTCHLHLQGRRIRQARNQRERRPFNTDPQKPKFINIRSDVPEMKHVDCCALPTRTARTKAPHRKGIDTCAAATGWQPEDRFSRQHKRRAAGSLMTLYQLQGFLWVTSRCIAPSGRNGPWSNRGNVSTFPWWDWGKP